MGINTTLASLSQNPALNGPDGASDPPAILDDGLRYALSFIAQLRDGVGFTPGINMPVKSSENSTGGVSIGYSTSLSRFTIADGATVYAKWPIDISGKADAAGTADTATTATNANSLGGVPANGFTLNLVPGNGPIGFRYETGAGYLVVRVDGNEFSGVWPIYVDWSRVNNRPTNLSQFSNGPGYQTASDVSGFAVQRIDQVTQLGNVGSTSLRANISGFGLVGWGVTPSDARLKKEIAPTREDSLHKISQIDFRQFRFRSDVTQEPIDDGRLHRLGVIAQELEMLDPAWVSDAGTWKTPDQQALIYAALHAIQQLRARVAVLEACA
ncbi:tail fiber domain-containing protein [Variovorax sp.]|uniref:tail fiber domain-containing protein n=1 Tax=Variovorax sp. TaxID=1871043 RepID=UPI003BAC79B3